MILKYQDLILQFFTMVSGVVVTGLGFYKVYSNGRAKELKELKRIIKEETPSAKLTKNIFSMKDKTERIKHHLESTRHYLKADQIWLGLFHNGQYTIGHEHLVKITSLYEVPDGGYVHKNGERFSTNELIDNVPILHLGEWIDENINDNWYVIDVDDIASPLLKESFLDWGLKGGVNVILYADDDKKLPIGVVGINWVQDSFDLLEFLGVSTTKKGVEKLRGMLGGLTNLLKPDEV